MSNAKSQLPKYQCHKQVRAFKIAQITKGCEECGDGSILIPEGGINAGFMVQKDWMEKHSPEVGGYYVVYDSDYSSYSPADAFESGYSLIQEEG